MYRRLLVAFRQRLFLVFFLICLGCSAQSVSPDLSRRIEKQVRAYYTVAPDVAISLGPLKPSEFTGYDAVTVTLDNGSGKRNYDFLVSKDRKTLIRMTKLDLTQDPYAGIEKKIDLRGRPVRGNKDAKVVAVNFDDFECPFCSRMHQTLFPELLKEYGDRVAFIYKDFPLAEIHPWATHAAVDANCLGAQNNDAYWELADYIHSNQHEINSQTGLQAQFAALDKLTLVQGQNHHVDMAKLDACVKAQDDTEIKASVHQGESVDVDATPTMFVNGMKTHDGAMTLDEMRAALDEALREAGETPPPHPNAASPTSGGQ
jgi:protein-disulfide isomerase